MQEIDQNSQNGPGSETNYKKVKENVVKMEKKKYVPYEIDEEEEEEVQGDRSQQMHASTFNKVNTSPGKSQRATIDVLGYAPTNTYLSQSVVNRSPPKKAVTYGQYSQQLISKSPGRTPGRSPRRKSPGKSMISTRSPDRTVFNETLDPEYSRALARELYIEETVNVVNPAKKGSPSKVKPG